MKRLVICLVVCVAVLLGGTAWAYDYSPMDLSVEEKAAVNLFLSNFTEIGDKSYDAYGDDMNLVDFAHDHMWFNDNDEFEYGEYDNENNCRVADDRIQEIVDNYFYYPREVDLSQTRYDYADGYYYGCETGGFVNSGFAHVVSVCPIDDGNYFVAFMVFAGGENWDNSVMEMPMDEIEAEYGHPTGYGSAIIHAEDLCDRDTYRMISFGRV